MAKNKNEILRLQNLIENDRMLAGDNFLELVRSDVNKLLKEYFDFKSMPTLVIEKTKIGYELKISLFAERIKSFTSIPG